MAEIPCGRKGCSYCGVQLRRRYVAHFAQTFSEFAQSGPVWFVTFTVDRKVMDAAGVGLKVEDSRKYLVHCFEKFRKRLNRRCDSHKYAASFEQHQDGYWHLHAIYHAQGGRFEASETDVRAMMREQWFASGGGAVARIKRIRPDSDSKGDDMRPDSVAGAVGYVVKYCFKDALAASQGGVSRRSLICSQGVGYHSAQAKAERKAHARSSSPPNDSDSDVVETWSPFQTGLRSGCEDTLTPKDRARFASFDASKRTREYRERSESPDFGRIWTVYRYDALAGTVEWTVYDRWPEAEGARILELHRPNGPNSPPDSPRIFAKENPVSNP
jgi:hypothetical protein